jgi:hypothetical protein
MSHPSPLTMSTDSHPRANFQSPLYHPRAVYPPNAPARLRRPLTLRSDADLGATDDSDDIHSLETKATYSQLLTDEQRLNQQVAFLLSGPPAHPNVEAGPHPVVVDYESLDIPSDSDENN